MTCSVGCTHNYFKVHKNKQTNKKKTNKQTKKKDRDLTSCRKLYRDMQRVFVKCSLIGHSYSKPHPFISGRPAGPPVPVRIKVAHGAALAICRIISAVLQCLLVKSMV